MKNIFQFKKTTNPTDIVAEKATTNENDMLKPTQNNNNHNHLNTLSELPFFMTQTINSTFKRRFSENYYKAYDIHKRPRLVKKCGELNIHMENVPKHKRRLLSDFFNTILDIKWRWHIAIFLLSFLISWFLFATIWYMIALIHGDLSNKNETHVPCVTGVHDFTSALLYSVETQHTIGYGLRHITEECSFAIIFLMLQSCFGIFVQGLVAGVVFAKISRPNKRKRTIIFSHNAVVSERDGKLCFMFKLANIRISQLSDAKIKMIMIKSRRTDEGEFIPFQSYDMKVGHNWSGNDSVFFPWPKTVEHVIDEDSPLYEICKQAKRYRNKSSSHKSESEGFDEMSDSTLSSTDNKESDLLINNNKYAKNTDYEIVVILEGNIETTGASCHIRTSYLPQEILFGYRFVPVYPKFTDFEYLFDYSKFDQVEPFQFDLLDLNVAFNNPHLNLVYDARAEDKNFNLTCQNTLQKEDKPKCKPSVPLASIFEPTPTPIETIGKSRSLFDKKSNKSELEQLNPKSNDIEETKNGRFTICAVDKNIKTSNQEATQLDNEQTTSLVSMSINERLLGTVKNNDKKFANNLSKQVLFQLHKRQHIHQRTNSLPNSQSDIVNNCNDDEGYLTSNKHNSKVDLNE